ncbi:hypothetical protein F383_34244 [Gossypium arboreum]|uniref:Uncharacterized protein n=1 Tax=Gossypium arboreum TaxID=29729 RepID=A0A0B0N3Y1_GOSAR|nr:hypothetical protein F383_34244 [Gossypium arboreum]
MTHSKMTKSLYMPYSKY